MPSADRNVERWETKPTVFEKPDEAILAFAACLIIGILTLLTGVFIITCMCSIGAFLTGRHLLELAEDGQRYRTLGRAIKGRIAQAGGGHVDVDVDRGTADYPATGARCHLYTPDDSA
mgnify:CR=1 FL=1